MCAWPIFDDCWEGWYNNDNDDDFDSLLTFKGKGGVDLLAGRQTQTRGDYWWGSWFNMIKTVEIIIDDNANLGNTIAYFIWWLVMLW